MEATAIAYVTSGDVCATLYASSPAMHSSLLRAFAGANGAKAYDLPGKTGGAGSGLEPAPLHL